MDNNKGNSGDALLLSRLGGIISMVSPEFDPEKTLRPQTLEPIRASDGSVDGPFFTLFCGEISW